MLYIGSLTYLFNSFCMSHYLATTSSRCIFLFKFLLILQLSTLFFLVLFFTIFQMHSLHPCYNKL
jgi:hypothetical protein